MMKIIKFVMLGKFVNGFGLAPLFTSLLRPEIRSGIRSFTSYGSEKQIQFKREILDEQEMESFGASFCQFLEVGDTILLRGDLGAGKSTFARGLVREAFNDPTMLVTSPSYLLSNKYQLQTDVTIYHMDLYRLPSKRDVSFLNIPQIYRQSINLIEWPERLSDSDYPKEYIDLVLSIQENDKRTANLDFIGDKWAIRKDQILQTLTTSLSP